MDHTALRPPDPAVNRQSSGALPLEAVGGRVGVSGVRVGDSISGVSGVRGVSGERGVRGVRGVSGVSGVRGVRGVRGVSGW